MRQAIVFGALVLVLGCGGKKKTTDQEVVPPTPTAIEVHPSAVDLVPKAVQQFDLSPSTVSVSWSVTETTGGTITQNGLYTAPGYSGTFHVVATSTANTSISAQAIVNVDSGIAITAISPVSAFACEAVTLKATVSGSTDAAVIWSAPASCGTVTTTGLFTSARGTGTCVVTAQAHADPAKMAQITVNVASERVLSIALNPTAASLGPGGTQAFAANVTTACGTFPAGM
jgi:hypothetical protein